ncbi:MAG: DUF1214 domain-containing protein [Bacteroidales bacterium]|nr:DUF1214 domain-containing protein [Bacteroidales bacterium]
MRSADVNGSSLEGGRHYKLHLPSGLPVCSFWSVIVYDNETRLIIHTDQLWPSVHSNSKRLKVSSDGSVNVLFGPVPPGSEGKTG